MNGNQREFHLSHGTVWGWINLSTVEIASLPSTQRKHLFVEGGDEVAHLRKEKALTRIIKFGEEVSGWHNAVRSLDSTPHQGVESWLSFKK